MVYRNSCFNILRVKHKSVESATKQRSRYNTLAYIPYSCWLPPGNLFRDLVLDNIQPLRESKEDKKWKILALSFHGHVVLMSLQVYTFKYLSAWPWNLGLPLTSVYHRHFSCLSFYKSKTYLKVLYTSFILWTLSHFCIFQR